MLIQKLRLAILAGLLGKTTADWNITAWETGCHPGEDPDEADSTNTYSYSYSWELLEALGEDHIEDCRMFQITGAHNIYVEGVEADKVEITVYNDAGCSGGYELAKITTDGCKVVAMDQVATTYKMKRLG